MAGDEELIPIHTRDYHIDAFKRGGDAIVLRGTVHDVKPAGLYIADDDQELTIHRMVVELHVAFPSYEITWAGAVFDGFPNEVCPSISATYEQLIGLSISRGFTHKVRELFGGPRGCTHVTALLQAMAPVAIQCSWSMRVIEMRELQAAGKEIPANGGTGGERAFQMNLNTCHVWDEHGDHVAQLRAGNPPGPPLTIRKRMRELGRDESEWLRLRS